MLKISNLAKVFGSGTINEKSALDDLSLNVNGGDFITVIGNNGAGKSTLLNCIAGVHIPDGGKIILDGKDITKEKEFKRSRYIGRVFQDPLKGTAHDMTIEENMAIAYNKAKPKNLSRGISDKDRTLFHEYLKRLGLGLEDRMKEKVRFLSGGQRQALTLLMANMADPKILLLDEHTAALDPSISKTVLELTDEFSDSMNLCTIMITHNMKAALEHGNRTIVMKNGNIALDLKGEERVKMTVELLVEQFEIDNDRMLIT